MSTNNLIKALEDGKQLSPIGKLQLAVSLIQEVMLLDFWTEDDSKRLVSIQYELWLFASGGSHGTILKR